MSETDNKTNANFKKRSSPEPKVSVTLKRMWKAENSGVSLKVFARRLKKSGDALAKRWFENRSGKHDAKRSDKNSTAAKLIGEATRQSRKKMNKK